MNNFSINPNFNMNGFNNSIQDFNKIFSNSLEKTNQNINNANFEEVFNSFNQTNTTKPIQAQVDMNVGLDSINAQKIESLSPTAQMAKDIGKGFSGSINELNEIEKKSENDIETFASGGDISVHEVMISAQKSQLAMQMAIQLRNQMINAYTEFKNMSI